MFNVIIIEDDPMVASINRQYTELNRNLRVVGQFSNGQEALNYLTDHTVHLIIMDMYMPIMDGAEFLKELRKNNKDVDVIMVTAANDNASIKQLMTFGILDYLVKPFEYVRFNHALALFLQRRELFKQSTMTQQDLDAILSSNAHMTPQEDLNTKGLQEKTLNRILDFMSQHSNNYLTSETISEGTTLSKVTIRRYMNYLLEHHRIVSTVNYTTGGRPSIMYQIVK